MLQPTNNNEMDNDQREELRNSHSSSTFKIIRASVVFFGLLGVALNSITGFALPNTNVECIVDYTLNWTASFNSFFEKDQYSKFLLLILSGICVDMVMIMLGISWIMFGKSWRVIITLTIFYLFKFVIQFIFQEKIPDGYLWEYPGFPSLMVSYVNSNTLFYSTTVGFLLIGVLEFWKLKNYYLFGFAITTLFVEIFTLNVLRANYIIDVTSALVIAHFIFMIVDELCSNYLDNTDNEWFNLEDISKTDETSGYKPVSNFDKDKEKEKLSN